MTDKFLKSELGTLEYSEQHALEAERLLNEARGMTHFKGAMDTTIALAQVHATLAVYYQERGD